jgi:basic membrane lipoprotein Med (substrate-binding protein (PBP1-ABC) superfamily)
VAPPDFDRVVTQLVRTGHRLIFTTSFSYFAPTQRLAPQHPGVFFENATGPTTLPNMAIYNARFYEGRYIQGVIAARKSIPAECAVAYSGIGMSAACGSMTMSTFTEAIILVSQPRGWRGWPRSRLSALQAS